MLVAGEKVFIRFPRIKDELVFLQAVKDCQKYHHPWSFPPNNKQQFLNYVRLSKTKNQVYFLIFVHKTNQLVGTINLSHIIRGSFQSAYLGYDSFLPNSKKGYMTEGLELVINYAFFNLHLHRIEANIQPENTASINLVKRLGFEKEGMAKNYLNIQGYWKNHIRFALTLEKAQANWLNVANKKNNPWNPDFKFSQAQLKTFLKKRVK